MDIFLKVILAILIFLAVSSGVTKIMLMPQEVDFFSNYGFTNPILIAYGAAQLIGGIMLIMKKTRFIGAFVVSITFLISAVVLIIAGNTPLTIVTFVAIFMLGIVMNQSFKKEKVSAT